MKRLVALYGRLRELDFVLLVVRLPDVPPVIMHLQSPNIDAFAL